jgi:hypothetical protein
VVALAILPLACYLDPYLAAAVAVVVVIGAVAEVASAALAAVVPAAVAPVVVGNIKPDFSTNEFH